MEHCLEAYILLGTVKKDPNTYEWELDTQSQIIEESLTHPFHIKDEIVDYNGDLYSVNRNIASGSAFVTTDWDTVDVGIAHTGKISKIRVQQLNGENFDPSLELESLHVVLIQHLMVV